MDNNKKTKTLIVLTIVSSAISSSIFLNASEKAERESGPTILRSSRGQSITGGGQEMRSGKGQSIKSGGGQMRSGEGQSIRGGGQGMRSGDGLSISGGGQRIRSDTASAPSDKIKGIPTGARQNISRSRVQEIRTDRIPTIRAGSGQAIKREGIQSTGTFSGQSSKTNSTTQLRRQTKMGDDLRRTASDRRIISDRQRVDRRDGRMYRRGRGVRGGRVIIDSGFWRRPGWERWYGPYWGQSGSWLDFGGFWSDQSDWPQVYNETGERIKFYVSERYGSSYTLTVVTESGETKTFPALEIPEMQSVEVFIDSNGELQIAPR